MPDIVPVDYATAVKRALERLGADAVETTWSGALSSNASGAPPVRLTSREGMILEERELDIEASAARVFAAFTRLGGAAGWPSLEWAWHIRGWIDRLVGGVGMRRGRRHPTELRVGDPVDFWRVEEIEPNLRLRLRAEMKVPGRAWLEFEAIESEPGHTRLRQTAYFAPHGLFGLIYWYALYPVHGLVFGRMIAALGREAEEDQSGSASHSRVS